MSRALLVIALITALITLPLSCVWFAYRDRWAAQGPPLDAERDPVAALRSWHREAHPVAIQELHRRGPAAIDLVPEVIGCIGKNLESALDLIAALNRMDPDWPARPEARGMARALLDLAETSSEFQRESRRAVFRAVAKSQFPDAPPGLATLLIRR